VKHCLGAKALAIKSARWTVGQELTTSRGVKRQRNDLCLVLAHEVPSPANYLNLTIL
jgi:hypothetical protein